MDLSTVQSMLLMTLGVIPLTAFMAVGISQNVVSEINQIVKSVIRCANRVSTMRNQRKKGITAPNQPTKITWQQSRSIAGDSSEPRSKQSKSRTSYLRSSRETAVSSSPGQDDVMLFLSIEEPRLTHMLKRLQTIRQPITDADAIGG
eukprot:6479848-Amphidinium_carterae.3